MNIETGADKFADWLHQIRQEGRAMPTNLVYSARMVLKCSIGTARKVKSFLVEAERLVANPQKQFFSIDGKTFNLKIEDKDEWDVIKTALRKRYKPVYDPRTVEQQAKVAKGEPELLVIGSELVPFPMAKQMAEDIGLR